MSHSHRWSYFYVPGDAYRYCGCGAIETVSPDGEHGSVPANELGSVRRHIERLEKSAEAIKKTLGPFTFEIDRPEGTTKKWPGGKSFTYPVDYGFFPKLTGEDGEGLDAFVGDDPAGHLESFQKLKPNEDGKLVADETKYLLGVNDRQRETIYKLYGREINARRVYDSWEDVERSLERFEKGAASADAPSNLLGLVGTPQYYLTRAADFRRRHPDLRAPDYYNEYGDRYAHRFENQTRPRLSPKGQAWFDKTKHGLQYAIEQKRIEDPAAFDALERDPKAFHRFAYDTHGPVYLNSGIRGLPLRDLLRVARTPDLKDVVNRDGLRLAGQVLNPFNKAAAERITKTAVSVDYALKAFHNTAEQGNLTPLRAYKLQGAMDALADRVEAKYPVGMPLPEHAQRLSDAVSALREKATLDHLPTSASASARHLAKARAEAPTLDALVRANELVYSLPQPSLSPPSAPVTPGADMASGSSMFNRSNAEIAGGTLAMAAALYGGHRWLRSRREKEQEKVADAAEQEPPTQAPPQKSWLRRNAAPIAGLTTAAVAAPLIYRYLRKQRLSNDPALRAIQEASGGRFGRVLEGRQEALSAPRRWIDRLIYSGGGDVHYQDNLIEAARKSGKTPQVGGVLLHNAPGKQLAQGASNLIANRDSDAVSSVFDNGNKWQEYNIFEHFAPGSMGKTENVADVLADMGHNLGARNPRERGQQVEAFRKAMANNGARRRDMLAELQGNLRQRFGDGFLLKDVDAAATGGKFPSDLHDFTELVNEDSPAAKTLINAIKDPRSVIAQSKLPLAQGSWLDRQFAKLRGLPSTQEVRVHVMNGAVAPDLTVPRFSPTMWLTGRKAMRGADQYARDLLTKLPEELQRGTYAMDVAPLVGGGYKLIESNPGYRSGFLSPGNHPVIGPLLHKQFTGQHSQTVAGLGAGAGAVAGGLTAAAGARYLANRQQSEQEPDLHGVKQASAFDSFIKEARVPTHVKQYRRALQMLAEGQHDFHGTDAMLGPVMTGEIRGGRRDMYGTGGKAYFARGFPAMEYFDASDGREGGFAIPRAQMDAAGGKVIRKTQSHPIPYVAAQRVPLERGASVLATDPKSLGWVEAAQRKFKLRRIDADPLQKALDTVQGTMSTGEADHILRGRDGAYVPSGVVSAASPVSAPVAATAPSVSPILNRRNAAIAGGTLATAAALYGGHRWLRSRREKEQEKAASAFDALNWVPAPFQGRVQSPQEIVYAARSTPALAATQENLRLLQVAQDPYGTGSPTQGVAHHRRHYG